MASSDVSIPSRPSIEELAKLIRRDSYGKPRIMGIVNATPDSFHKESRSNKERAVELALMMEDSGADWIDIGG